MSKYDAVYFVCDNPAINRVQFGSSKTRNQENVDNIGFIIQQISPNES